MPVQQLAQWQLDGREAEEITTRQQAQIARLQGKLLRQYRRQSGGDGAYQRRAKIGSGKSQENNRPGFAVQVICVAGRIRGV